RLALDTVQQLDALLVERIEPACERHLEELFLAAEVVVDRREVHARRGRELAQARRLEAVDHEQLLGGIEDARLRVRGGGIGGDVPARGPCCRHVVSRNDDDARETDDSNGRLKRHRKGAPGPSQLKRAGWRNVIAVTAAPAVAAQSGSTEKPPL